MKSKEEMFKITSVIMQSGCTKYILYRNLGWVHAILFGSRYVEIGKFDSVQEAGQFMNTLYQIEANSCMKSKEKHVWPN